MRNPGMLIVGRALRRLISNPAPLLSGLGMSAFFLFVYDAAIGGIGFLPEFGGAGYMAFLLPMGVISLLFLAPTFVPRELMGARWLQVVSAWNPLSYLMEAMRVLVSGLGEPGSVPVAFAIAGAAGVGGTALAAMSVRKVLN